MKILAFDTSTNIVSVAISDGDKILAYLEDLRPSMQAERLLPMIQEALHIASLTYQDLDYLAAVNGPGSFTGIRIGLAAAKAIEFATQIKAVSVTNFDIVHFRASEHVKNYEKLHIFLNAYRGQLYSQAFDQKGSKNTPELIGIDEARAKLSSPFEITACSGNGVFLLYDQIKNIKNLIILPRFSRIKAYYICRYVNHRLLNSGALPPLEPLYIRPPDAKIPESR